jgi:hypothetical protein
MKWLRKLLGLCDNNWKITMYIPYIDASWGVRIESVRYEAISSKGRRISKYIYNSKLTTEDIKTLLDNGNEVGRAL